MFFGRRQIMKPTDVFNLEAKITIGNKIQEVTTDEGMVIFYDDNLNKMEITGVLTGKHLSKTIELLSITMIENIKEAYSKQEKGKEMSKEEYIDILNRLLIYYENLCLPEIERVSEMGD